MSWDIVLFSSSQKINAPEEIDETKFVPVDFCSALERHFPNFIRYDTHGEIKGKDFSIVYYYDDEPTSNTILNLYGEAALLALIPLAIENNWQIFDTGSGEMADLTKPSKNGYKKFMSYLNHVLKK